MSGRIADPWRFHAEGALLGWPAIVRQLYASQQPGVEDLARRAAAAGTQVHLRWSVSDHQGIPPGPFTVWTRPAKPAPTTRPFRGWGRTIGGLSGEEVVWDWTPMATVTLQVAVSDPAQAVVAFGFMGSPAGETLVAASVQPAGAATATLTVRAGAMLSAFVVNGTVTGLLAQTLDATVNDPTWQAIELVGLPVEPGDWAGTAYDTGRQGMRAAPVDPVAAAVDRLTRGMPAFGWWPATGTGHPAPSWRAPDPAAFVEEARRGILAEVQQLFAPGVVPDRQAAIVAKVAGMVGPTQDGRTVAQTTTASHYPFATLQLGTATDSFAALGLGFGTAYRYTPGDAGGAGNDYLVTADYPAGVSGDGTPATRAAFVPAPGPHLSTPPVTGLAAARAGLVGPAARDGAWRESIRLSWDRVEPTAALDRPSGHAMCRYDQPAGSPAEVLLEKRDSGGWRPVAPTPRPLASPPGAYADRVDWTTQAEQIPLGSGGRHVGYAVATVDVYGVWSSWQDVAWDGTEPGTPGPQVVSARLDTTYAGATTCPATLEVHLAVDWTARTPTVVSLLGVLAGLGAANSPLPSGTTALGPPPAGAVRHDVVLPVGGPDGPEGLTVPAGASVDYLDATAATVVPGPGDAEQGSQARHYRLRLPLSLDFAAAAHYALALWAVETDLVGTSTPGPAPVVARVSTPVPLTVTFPALPVVPLASAPDAQGHSHGQIAWPPFAGATTVTVWTCPETAVRNAAGLGAIPPLQSLSQRFADVKAAYDGLPPDRRRAIFRRDVQVAGTAVDAQVTLPPGTDEIVLFAVTASNAGHVESAWPATADQLRAYTRPRLVAPATPEVIAVAGAGGTATVTVTVAGTVAPVRAQIFRTAVADAATSVDLMGPPVAEVSAFTLGGDGRWSATVADTPGSSWRTTWYRATAWAADDPTQGVVGIRSAGSIAFPLLAPPDGAPDVSAATVSFWASDRDGVLAAWSTDAPPQAGRYGPSTTRVVVTRDAAPGDPPLVDRESRLDALPVDAGVSPPADVTGGVLARSLRNAGRTPMHLWLRRSAPDDLLTMAVTVTDPLGRSTTVRTPVPAVPADPPPEVSLGAPHLLPGGVLVPFTSHVPITAVLDGVYRVDAYAAHPLAFPPPPPPPPLIGGPVGLPGPVGVPAPLPVPLPHPIPGPIPFPPPHPAPLHVQVPMPEIPVITSLADIPPGTVIGVFRVAASHPPQYLVMAALTHPVAVRVVVTAPDGGSAQGTVTA